MCQVRGAPIGGASFIFILLRILDLQSSPPSLQSRTGSWDPGILFVPDRVLAK